MRINPTKEQMMVQKDIASAQDTLTRSSALERPQGREVAFLQRGNQEEKRNELGFDKLGEIIEALNQFMRALDVELRFQIHEPTHEVIARLINKETGEVIREIPPEKFLDMLAKLQELAGLFVDELR